MEAQYHPKSLESRIQAEWVASRAFAAPDVSPKPKYYCVSMLPYPSGKLHMGHVRNYTINDVLYHFMRMKGWNALMPMGWDAFGLPAENAAMANKVPPAKWTWDNIAYMKQQCQAMGWAIDWTREVATCSPSYYRWNQWFFLRLWEKGLIYKKTGVVNWDPVDMTVLANEQVIDGRGWRTGAIVEKREIPMWYMRITQYADELLDSLDGLGWPEQVKQMQRNWIGRSEGVEFTLPYAPETASRMNDGKKGLAVFTTRADTIMGITFAAVAAEHPLAIEAARDNPALATFIEECKRGGVQEAELATMEKKGMATGLFVLHPFTQAKIPVWIGNYVLMSYGEGAVMGVPAHDERDWDFAAKYDLPNKLVVGSEQLHKDWRGVLTAMKHNDIPVDERVIEDLGILKYSERFLATAVLPSEVFEALSTFHSQALHESPSEEYGYLIAPGPFNGMNYERAVSAVAEKLEAGQLGNRRVQYRLRDWGISRQRYWGTPIPIVKCAKCGDVGVPDAQLPVVLPEDLVPDGTGSPLAKTPSFYETTCPKCAGPAKRETDTMDTFVDSSWYFMRYTCPDATSMVDERAQHWMPVDMYIGGIEHAILHLLYARFWTKAMRDMGLIKFDEPFANLLTQGMVLNHIYSRRTARGGIEYFAPDEVDVVLDADGHITGATLKNDGSTIDYEGIGTMSKSKRNGVDPQEMVERYGADTARFYVMSANPPTDTMLWSDQSVEGSFKFLRRLWAMVHEHVSAGVVARYPVLDPLPKEGENNELSKELKDLRFKLHKTIEKVADDYGRRLQFNTAIAALRELLNLYETVRDHGPIARAVAQEVLEDAVLLFSPIIPHITTALWSELRPGTRLLDQPWPAVDAAALVQDSIELVIQVNGKLRGHIHVPSNANRDEIESHAMHHEAVVKFLAGQKPKKVVVVPGRLVNVVV